MGGGCAIAVACDLRLCADTARFGVPVARTLGNCLSVENLARLVDLIGVGRATDMMVTGRLVSADQALEWGLATRVSPVGELEADTQALAADLATRATSTITATKAMLRRLRAARRLSAGRLRRPDRGLLRQRRLPRGRDGVCRAPPAVVRLRAVARQALAGQRRSAWPAVTSRAPP